MIAAEIYTTSRLTDFAARFLKSVESYAKLVDFVKGILFLFCILLIVFLYAILSLYYIFFDFIRGAE